MYLVSTTSTPKFFFEFYVLLQMHAHGTLELEKSAMHHHTTVFPIMTDGLC